MGRKIVIKSKATKEGLQEKVLREANKVDDGSKLRALLKKREKGEISKKDKEEYFLNKPKYESSSDDVNEVALRIAERFPYKDIFNANDDPKKAPHVHGWLQDNYRNFQWLIDNYVLEVACWYSKNKLEHKVEIVKIVSGISLRDYKCSRLELESMKRFQNYPEQPFVNVMFFGEEYLDDALLWIEDAEWIIDGEDVRINLGRYGGELIAWLTWNVPVILITYVPFKNVGIYKAKLEAQELKEVILDKRLKLIHTYRTMIETLEAKVDEKAREAKQWKKMYSDFKKDIDLETRRRLAKLEYSNADKKVIKRTYNINYILIIVVVVMIIISILGWLN